MPSQQAGALAEGPQREAAPAISGAIPGARFVALDGMRGVFALAVALYHFYAGVWVIEQTAFHNLFLLVDFFFVLSGFVIWNAYSAKVEDGPAVAGFLIKRFGRLWPMHAAVLAALLVLELAKLAISSTTATETAAFSGTSSVESLFASVFLVHALGLFQEPVWNGPSWSISVELFAYLVFLPVAMAPKAMRALVAVVLLIIALAAVIAGGEYLTGTTRFGFPRCVAGFCAGMLVAIAGRRLPAGGKAPGVAMELAVAAALVVVMTSVTSTAQTLWALPVFVLGVHVFARSRGPVSALLTTPVFQYLGERSYCIYIVHFLVVRSLFRAGQVFEASTGATIFEPYLWRTMGGEAEIWIVASSGIVGDLLAYAIYLTAVLVAAEIGYRLVERPSRRWFRRVADRTEARLRGRPETLASLPGS
jgi:peptidoglycan/LPS O-acetylase OafA/YrhL